MMSLTAGDKNLPVWDSCARRQGGMEPKSFTICGKLVQARYPMRRPLIVLGLLLFGTIAWACGDKLMLVMGSRSSQIKPFPPASILVYPGRSASAALIRGFQSLPAFRKAGHR